MMKYMKFCIKTNLFPSVQKEKVLTLSSSIYSFLLKERFQ